MENTPNYNLNLPDYEDFADVEKLNENFEIIDTQMKSTEDVLTTHLDNITPHGETTSKVLYVDVNNGSNENEGTVSNPFKSINYALSTLKKNLFVPIKIRVLPGDYRAEGQIVVSGFNTSTLTITAFDGQKDVTTLNDNYIIKKVGLYECDSVTITGFKIVNADSDYGAYAQSVYFVKFIGIKNDSTSSGDGFGVTFNSVAHILNCLCANKGTVVSSNNGSKVISEGWHVESINNITTLKAQWGGQIHKIGHQPNGTNNNQHINAGVIFEESGEPFTLKTFNAFLTKDATLTGVITLPISMPYTPRWVKVESGLIGTNETCSGSASINGTNITQSAVARNNSGSIFGSYSLVHLTDDGANTVQYEVISATKDAITINVIKTGNPTGTIAISVLCG